MSGSSLSLGIGIAFNRLIVTKYLVGAPSPYPPYSDIPLLGDVLRDPAHFGGSSSSPRLTLAAASPLRSRVDFADVASMAFVGGYLPAPVRRVVLIRRENPALPRIENHLDPLAGLTRLRAGGRVVGYLPFKLAVARV